MKPLHVILTAAVIGGVIYGTWFMNLRYQYHIYIEDMVKSTIVDVVKKEALK